MPLRHVVAADEDRLAGQDPHPPVVVGVEEFLGQDQVRVLEQPARDSLQLRAVVRLEDPAGERAVGDLQHDGVRDLRFQLVQAFAAHDLGLRRRHPVGLEQFRQVDLVRAAQDGIRVVQYHHALALGLLGEAVRVVVDLGRLANEERVVFREPPVVLAGDQVHVHPEVAPRGDEPLQGLRVGGRHRLVGVVQHGQFVLEVVPRSGLAPALREVAVERGEEALLLGRGERVHRHRADLVDSPRTLHQPELHAQQRAAEGLEDLPRDVPQFLHLGVAEADRDLVRGGLQDRFAPPEDLLHLAVQVLGRQTVDGAAREVLDGAHRGHHLVAPGLGEQRAVVADGQVAVAAAEVDDAHLLARRPLGAVQVIPRRDDGEARVVRLPIGGVLDQQNVLSHGPRSGTRSPPPAGPRARSGPCARTPGGGSAC